MPPVLRGSLRALLRAGYVVKLGGCFDDSYYGTVFNKLDQPVGTLEYRSPLDEPSEHARGLSYASLVDVAFQDDAAQAVLAAALGTTRNE